MLFILLVAVYCAEVSFQIPAHYANSQDTTNHFCITHHATKGAFLRIAYTAVTVDQQRLELKVIDQEVNSVYYSKPEIDGKATFVLTAQRDGNVMLCFTNYLHSSASPGPHRVRDVQLVVDDGASAMDREQLQRTGEHLEPMDLELRRYELMMQQMVREMEDLKQREMSMRDLNEATLERLNAFSILVMAVLIGLGVWQIVYMRRFFIAKHLI